MKNNNGYILLLLGGLVLGITAGRLGIEYAFLLGGIALFPLCLALKPELGLYFLAAYSVVDYALRAVTVGGGIIGSLWHELFFVAIVLMYLVHLVISSRGFKYRLTSLDMPIFIFAGVSIFLLLVNSPELLVAVEGLRVVVQYLLWYFVVVNIVRDKLTVKRVLNVLVIITAGIALHGIYQYIVGVEIPTTWYDSSAETYITSRVFSIIGSPNILGSMMVLTSPVTFSLALNEKRLPKKMIYLGMLLAMLLCLVFTLSRGAWLAFGLTVLIYAFMKDRRLVIPAAVAGLILLAAVPQIGERIAYMLSPQYMASSAVGGRIARWTLSIEAIKTSPIFGVGLGQFGGATAMRHVPDAFYADNFYLKTFAEMGLVGFTAFIYLLYRSCIDSLREIRKTADVEFYNIGMGIFAGAVGILAHNAVENVFEVPMMTSYYWMMIALIISFKFIGVTGTDDSEEAAQNHD